MSVDVKKVTAAFERFAQSDYKQTLFTESLYCALRMSFGFIAHYDRAGFYHARFADPHVRAITFNEMAAPTVWPARPIETALRKIVLRSDLQGKAEREAVELTERLERAELARLKSKYDAAPPASSAPAKKKRARR